MLKNFWKPFNGQDGSILIYEVVIIFVFSLVMLSILASASIQIKALRYSVIREQAFQIAEAGTNYYQWHLAHFPTDYQDGTGAAGPYIHDYRDNDTQEVIGQYSLEITAPPIGSTIVTIRSTGWTYDNPNIRRVITSRYGIPSLAKYSFLTNTDVWIGGSESVNGEMHANGGIRFDGTGNAPITSAKQTYTCQTYHGCGPTNRAGIWGSAAQASQNFWQFPVPSVDFSTITSNLASMKTLGQAAGGIYLPPSNAQGYSLVFNAGGTVSVYKVTSLRSHADGNDVNGVTHSEDLDYNARTLQFTQALPANGIIYIEDRTWVEGTIAGRVTVAAAKLPLNPATAPSIIIPNNILYTAKDGSVALGLIAQKDILVSYFAPATLEIDAALIAQTGSTQRYFFSGNTKTSILTYGSNMSFGVWTWSWVNGAGTVTSGYQNTTTNYDTNLLYGPPPSFPLDGNEYRQISWTSN